MVTVKTLYEGLEIILKYANPDQRDEYYLSAQDEQIWAGNYKGSLMTEDDKRKMEKLGWFEDEGSWSLFV
jgi:hypothetical protein